MNRGTIFAACALWTVAGVPHPVAAQATTGATERAPLAAFGALAVGEWLSPDSRHVFSWGVDRRVIRSQSYFMADGQWELVSEGMWYWDPSEEVIRGIAVAKDMPVELFEYRSTVMDNRVTHKMTGHGPGGGDYVETWTFGRSGYRWTLDQRVDGTLERLMEGSYERGSG